MTRDDSTFLYILIDLFVRYYTVMDGTVLWTFFLSTFLNLYFLYIFVECVDHSFAYVAHFVLSRNVWIRTLKAAVASRRVTGTNLATHLSNLATHLST